MFKFIQMLLVVLTISLSVDGALAAELPEWDGVYLKDKDGNYEELKNVTNVRINSAPQGTLYYNTKDFSIIPAEKFKGIFIKGKDLLKSVSFAYADRGTEMSLVALFNRNKRKYIDQISVEPNARLYELKSRQVGEDARYFEPPTEAYQFFGTAAEGHFVKLDVGNGKYYFFGIDTAKGN